ncbi:MAG TPA: hypothetical protein VGB77_19125 [Abditibacteriaceae bacterium]|jgi:hypothetical protein
MKKSSVLLCAAFLTASFSTANFVLAAETPTAVSVASSGAVPTAAQVAERWRTYFQTLQNLPAWTYSSHMKLLEPSSQEPNAPRKVVSDIIVKFARNNKLFRREMRVRESDKAPFQTVIMTYNGQKFQQAVDNPQATDIAGHKVKKLMIQDTKPFPDDPTLSTTLHFALTMPFLFLGKEGDDKPFTNLSKATTWAALQKSITKIEAATWNNRPGFTITMPREKAEADPARFEIFMDSASGLPLNLKTIEEKTGALIGEMKITKLHEATDKTPAFPLLIELNNTAKGGGQGTIEVDAKSLNLAGSPAPAAFKVTAAEVEIVIEGDNIVYSKYPLKK